MFPFSFLSSFSAGRKWESHPPRWKSFSWSVRTYFHQPPPSPCTQPPPPSQPPTTSYERARARDNSRPCLFWWPLFSFFRTHFSFLNYKLEPNFGLRPPLPPSLAAPFLLKSAADGFILRQLLLRLVSFRSATCCSAVQLAVDRNRLA